MQKIKDLILKVYDKFTGCGLLEPKKFVCCFICIFLVSLIICAAVVIWIDPYMRYHRSGAAGLKHVYHPSEALIPGVMRYYEYDTVLFGSSVTQNFNINEINEILNCRSIKATSAGLDSESLDKYLDTTIRLRGKNLKRCVIGVDLFCFSQNARPRWKDYYYLYSDDFIIPEYFYSIDTAKAIGEMIVSNLRRDSDPVAEHQMDETKMFSNKPGLLYGKKHLEYGVMQLRDSRVPLGDESVANFEKHLYRHIRNNPDIRFDIFLPPYSIYFWCYQQEINELDKLLEFRERFAEGLLKFPNVVLHDFHSDFSICCNLENYKDVTHYSPQINTLILQKIASQDTRCDLATFRQRTAAIRNEVVKYQDEFARIRAQKDTIKRKK